MRIHMQRKAVLNVEHGLREIKSFDRSAFADAKDLEVAIVPDEHGLWVLIAQETAKKLGDVRILPGYHRVTFKLPIFRPTSSLH